MTAAQRAARMITPGQSRKLFALYREIGITDRGERLADIAKYLGIDGLSSSSALSLDEAKMMIDNLERRAARAERPRPALIESNSGRNPFETVPPVEFSLDRLEQVWSNSDDGEHPDGVTAYIHPGWVDPDLVASAAAQALQLDGAVSGTPVFNLPAAHVWGRRLHGLEREQQELDYVVSDGEPDESRMVWRKVTVLRYDIVQVGAA